MRDTWEPCCVYLLSVAASVPLQLFLFELQLQHDRAELHVKVVRSIQLPLVVLADVQSMPWEKEKRLLMSLCIRMRSFESSTKDLHSARSFHPRDMEQCECVEVASNMEVNPDLSRLRMRDLKIKEEKTDLSSSLRRLISSSSSRWIQVPSDLIFSKCCFTSSRHSAWWEHIAVNQSWLSNQLPFAMLGCNSLFWYCTCTEEVLCFKWIHIERFCNIGNIRENIDIVVNVLWSIGVMFTLCVCQWQEVMLCMCMEWMLV